jgi:hypothetical protein
MNLFFRLFLFILIFSSCANTQKTITSFVEATPVYKYTNAENWDIFEVTAYGTKSIEQLAENAKAQLMRELIKKGYNGIKDFKPLVTNPLLQEKVLNENFNLLMEINNDPNCVIVDYKRAIEPIFMSKRKTYTKSFLVTINVNNIKNKLKSLL